MRELASSRIHLVHMHRVPKLLNLSLSLLKIHLVAIRMAFILGIDKMLKKLFLAPPRLGNIIIKSLKRILVIYFNETQTK